MSAARVKHEILWVGRERSTLETAGPLHPLGMRRYDVSLGLRSPGQVVDA
jgi:hypothetical protein